MQTEARAVVIGGGVVGVSALYHLARKGWTDSVLLERKELTSGSTWHAAGLMPLFNMSYSVSKIHQYSVRFYQELQEETGMNVGFSKVSNIRLAQTDDRWDEYMYYAGIAETLGIDVKVLTPEEVKEVWPLADVSNLKGAIQHLEDGYIQPADLTQALAKGARDRGAKIHRNTAVTAIEQLDDGRWNVVTDKGEIVCEHVVSCTGNFARKHRSRWSGSTCRSSRSSTSTSSRSRTPRSRRARSAASSRWACCATPTPPGTCARRRAA